MSELPEHLTPERWAYQIFSSQEAMRGGVVKRKVRDVERLLGRSVFLYEVERRGYQAVENGENFVVFCNKRPIRKLR